MRKLLRPRIVIPAVLGAGMIVALFTLADARKVLDVILGFQHSYLLYFFGLMVIYEIVRCIQWHYLLRSLGIRAPLRSQVFAFAVGEITKSLPIGNYFQNYMLRQSQGTNFGLSSVATSLILLTEVVVSLVGVEILGLDGWNGWLRPTILIGVAIALLVGAFATWLFRQSRDAVDRRIWAIRHPTLRRVVEELDHYRQGIGTIARPRILSIQTVLSAMYLSAAAIGLYVLARGAGAGDISLGEAMAVYFFSLAVGLIVPIPLDIGLIEFSGIGAFLAIGVGRDVAIGVMLLNRILSLGAATLIAVIVMLCLPGELRAALRGRPQEEPITLPSHPAAMRDAALTVQQESPRRRAASPDEQRYARR
ncbi:MAG: lysylphosphatidylglycerol synthase transmembrane domain-containing protein [Ktedonobacterales bacterium]